MLAALALAGGAAALPAQGTLLEIRPRLGDTLRMQLDQRVEMVGTVHVASGDTTVTRVTVTRVVAHSVVEQQDRAGTTMLAVTDSVLVDDGGDGRDTTVDTAGASPVPMYALEGRRVHVRVAPDGATALVGGGDEIAPQLRSIFAQMPATLPGGPVVVGDTWARTMVIPSAGPAGAPAAGSLKGTFRLDSLSRAGEFAYISMRGALTRAGAPRELPEGVQLSMTGRVGGTLVLDRRRRWLTDARTTLTVHSVVTPRTRAGARPMRVRMTVTQWLRAM
jgi:hypothetical protein